MLALQLHLNARGTIARCGKEASKAESDGDTRDGIARSRPSSVRPKDINFRKMRQKGWLICTSFQSGSRQTR